MFKLAKRGYSPFFAKGACSPLQRTTKPVFDGFCARLRAEKSFSRRTEGELPRRGKRGRPGACRREKRSDCFRACGRETLRGLKIDEDLSGSSFHSVRTWRKESSALLVQQLFDLAVGEAGEGGEVHVGLVVRL